MSLCRCRRTRERRNRWPKTLPDACWAAFALTMLATAFVRAGSDGALLPHPRLLFNQEGIAALKQETQRAPWSQAWSRLRTSLDKQADRPIELPPRGGNWSHAFVWAVSLDAAPVQLEVESSTQAMVATVQIHSAHSAWRLAADAVHGKVTVAKDWPSRVRRVPAMGAAAAWPAFSTVVSKETQK